MPTTTITEALAEVKVVAKRIDSKSEFIARYLLRREEMRDPLERQGGAAKLVNEERQAIGDLFENIIRIRRAIAQANVDNSITVEGHTRSIADWLVWKREIAPDQLRRLRSLAAVIDRQRNEAQVRGRQVVGAVAISAGGDAKPGDIVVNINEQELAQQIERLETLLGTLDGQLSLKNATITVSY